MAEFEVQRNGAQAPQPESAPTPQISPEKQPAQPTTGDGAALQTSARTLHEAENRRDDAKLKTSASINRTFDDVRSAIERSDWQAAVDALSKIDRLLTGKPEPVAAPTPDVESKPEKPIERGDAYDSTFKVAKEAFTKNDRVSAYQALEAGTLAVSGQGEKPKFTAAELGAMSPEQMNTEFGKQFLALANVLVEAGEYKRAAEVLDLMKKTLGDSAPALTVSSKDLTDIVGLRAKRDSTMEEVGKIGAAYTSNPDQQAAATAEIERLTQEIKQLVDEVATRMAEQGIKDLEAEKERRKKEAEVMNEAVKRKQDEIQTLEVLLEAKTAEAEAAKDQKTKDALTAQAATLDEKIREQHGELEALQAKLAQAQRGQRQIE